MGPEAFAAAAWDFHQRAAAEADAADCRRPGAAEAAEAAAVVLHCHQLAAAEADVGVCRHLAEVAAEVMAAAELHRRFAAAADGYRRGSPRWN